MKDASDFSWDSAKAAHAILFTNMEADRVTWPESEKNFFLYFYFFFYIHVHA